VLCCRDTLEGDQVMIRPTHRCPPALLAALLAEAGEVRGLIEAQCGASGAGFYDAADVRADRAAVAADAPVLVIAPLAGMLEALAEAMAYFRSEAHRRLSLTNHPLARGLLLGAELHRSVPGKAM
jgi:hypothetical protein